jgi:hypothetical protein
VISGAEAPEPATAEKAVGKSGIAVSCRDEQGVNPFLHTTAALLPAGKHQAKFP